jgi:flagellar basal-body rod protein FlgF
VSDGMYIAMAGASARAAQLESISDNLANAQTPGFKKAEPAFETFLASSGAKEQAFPVAVQTAFDLSPGATLRTGEKLDVTPQDGAFLSVATPSGIAFTRAGHLTVDGSGALIASHHRVLDTHGRPVQLPSLRPGQAPEVRNDGTVWVGEERVAQLGTYRLAGALERVGPSLLKPQANGSATAVEPRVNIGELELGNASPLNCAVQLVAAQRHFETAMQNIQTYRRMDERSAEIGRVR